jgi:predicted nuclease of restriction endonuclease-like (RecB) superfamily
MERLSKDLSLIHGKGFSLSNVKRMRQFFVEYPNGATASHQLTWSHYIELLKISDPLEPSFYEQQSIIENWSIRDLVRQKKTSLFLRLAASKNKDEIWQLAQKGQIIERPEDIIREPYVLEFLHIPEPYHMSETELENRVIQSLQTFLLELGKGFAFIGRQYRITLDNRNFYVDLVFYHRILKCFVLIDLKKNEAGYEDIGQMNMYLGYFENEENTETDNPPIGIVLAREKDELLVKYAMHNMNSQLFVSKYQLYLPNKEELKALIERQLNRNEP